MALSDEQNAMLRLLASGEQGYDDIAALMGLSVDEVRAKVVGALAQLQAEGKPVPDVPPPLPGGARPAAEAVPPEPEPVPEPPAAKAEPPAEPVVADTVAPKADAEPKPAATATATGTASAAPETSASSPSDRPPSGGRTITLPTGRKAWWLGGGIVAAIVVIVVVILLVSGGGSSDNSSTSTGGEGGKAETTASESGKEPTTAELKAVDGSEAEGVATFGRYKKKLALAIEAKGLEGTTKNVDAYTVWLAQSPKKMLPLISIQVAGTGKRAGIIAGEYEVPTELLVYLADGTFDQIEITHTQTQRFEAGVKKATEEKTTPEYVGEPVLRGTITGPIVGIAKRKEEEKAEGE